MIDIYESYIPRHRRGMIKTQYRTFWSQNLCSVIIYLPILAIMAWLINTNPGWGYQPTVIFDNLEFNIAIGLIVFTGLASLALSYKPDCIKICLGANELKNKR